MPISPYRTLKSNKWPFPDPGEQSEPELFIIESMNDKDEKSGFFEGVRIAQILRLAGRRPKYFYVQNSRELELLVPVFRQSNYRYLHLSCHGDQDGFDLTHGPVLFKDFAEMFGETLKVRRLFVSACEAGQKALVTELHKTARGIQSVTAPRVKIDYDHAAAIWSAFYISLLEKKSGKCYHEDIITRMALLMRLFPYANVDDKTLMSFMFAGYAPDMEPHAGSDLPWEFKVINRSFQYKARKQSKKTAVKIAKEG